MSDFSKLPNGLYLLYWKDEYGGGCSPASVGCLSDGTRWFAPCNWINESKWTDWDHVEKVVRVPTDHLVEAGQVIV